MERKRIRKPVFAGSFYPEDVETLRFMINQHIRAADVDLGRRKLKAFLAPHAGYVYSGPTAGHSYKILKQHSEKMKDRDVLKVFILGPSHSVQLQHIALGSYHQWHTPFGEVQVSSINEKLAEEDGFEIYDQVYAKEHCVEVQLPFLQVALQGKDFEIIPMLCSKLNNENIVKKLNSYFDKNSILIISTDLSHYKPQKEAEEIDKRTISAIEDIDVDSLSDIGDACGLCGVHTVLKLSKKNRWKVNIADYKTSGDTAGSKDAVVGYVSAYFFK
jgi:hypothetical protein